MRVLVLLMALMMTACSGNERKQMTCLEAHEGVFKLSQESPVRIVREGDVQVEYSQDEAYAYVDSYHIQWVSDCQYMLSLISSSRPSDLEFTEEDTMSVTIVKRFADGYSYIASKTGKSFDGSLYRVED